MHVLRYKAKSFIFTANVRLQMEHEEKSVTEAQEHAFIRMAIDEAKKSKSEDDRIHPMVGAVVVKDGQVLGKAHRGELGPGDHAEFTLLEKKLGDATLVGATVYVTLEPCTTRKHPKVCCAVRLLERKVARVVIGMVDPDHRISGRGITTLREGRIEIGHFPDILAAEVEELNRHFKRSVVEAAKAAKVAEPTAQSVPQDMAASSVQITIHNSTIHGDVVGRDKKT